MIFVDSNIPMYLVGAEHPHKLRARQLLEQSITRGRRLVTDAETLQEILHRYKAINRLDAIQPAFEALLGVVDDVYPVAREDVERARDHLMTYPSISARDALHSAIMEKNRVEELLSFDRGFDVIPWIRRME